jgi:hypothetical protein
MLRLKIDPPAFVLNEGESVTAVAVDGQLGSQVGAACLLALCDRGVQAPVFTRWPRPHRRFA